MSLELTRPPGTLHELETELPDAAEIAPAAPGLIDEVSVIWINQYRTARDETAFRHALTAAHRLKAQVQPLKDAKIIEAYERSYNVAQAVGADNRQPDIPPMRDRLTMARRVRVYVTQGVINPNQTNRGLRQSSAGRKALATMGQRGGKATVARRTVNPKNVNCCAKDGKSQPAEKNAGPRHPGSDSEYCLSKVFRDASPREGWGFVIRRSVDCIGVKTIPEVCAVSF